MALTDIDGQRLGDSVSDKLGDRNLIINGAMNVAQRGTSSTSVGLGTVDRWHSGGAGGTITQTQESAASSDSPYDEGFRKFFRQTNTAVASASSHYRQIETKLEAQDIATSGWDYTSTSNYVTVSAWLRSSVAGTYSYQLRSADGTAQSYVGTVTLTANTWTKVTQTYPGNANLTFDNNTGLGLRVIWFPYLGADYTTSSPTLNAWHAFSGSNMASDDTAGWGTTAGATFDITGVQLEVGNTATPFQHRSYADELQRCQRYFYRKNAEQPYTRFDIGMAQSNVAAAILVQHPVRMRTLPNVGDSGAGTLQLSDLASGTVTSGALSVTANTNGYDQTSIQVPVASGLTQYRSYMLEGANNSNAYIEFSAEL
jgi:hypothetical protein